MTASQSDFDDELDYEYSDDEDDGFRFDSSSEEEIDPEPPAEFKLRRTLPSGSSVLCRPQHCGSKKHWCKWTKNLAVNLRAWSIKSFDNIFAVPRPRHCRDPVVITRTKRKSHSRRNRLLRDLESQAKLEELEASVSSKQILNLSQPSLMQE